MRPHYLRTYSKPEDSLRVTWRGRALALLACAALLSCIAPSANAFSGLLQRACDMAQGCTASSLGINVASHHERPGFNDINPGLYARNLAGYAAGAYINSHRRASVWAGRQFTATAGPAEAALLIGVATGYYRPLTPVVSPSLAITAGGITTRLSYVPRNPTKEHGASAVHLSLEWSLKP